MVARRSRAADTRDLGEPSPEAEDSRETRPPSVSSVCTQASPLPAYAQTLQSSDPTASLTSKAHVTLLPLNSPCQYSLLGLVGTGLSPLPCLPVTAVSSLLSSSPGKEPGAPSTHPTPTLVSLTVSAENISFLLLITLLCFPLCYWPHDSGF